MDTTIDDARQRHARDYAANWNVADGTGLVREVEDQFESWLRWKQRDDPHKHWDPRTEDTGFSTGPDGQELVVVHHDVRDRRELRLRLSERNDGGVWRTTVTVDENGDRSWISLRVANDNGKSPRVPKLAEYLLQALDLRDGPTQLSPSPRSISASEIDSFADELTNVDREGLCFVAGTSDDDDQSVDAFVDRVRIWTKGTRGLAQVAVLDPEGTRAFAEIVGPHHAVPPWTIRTFDADVDPAVESDGRRHRILGRKRLADPDGVTIGLLAHLARVHSAKRLIPKGFTAVDRALTRIEDKMLVDSLFWSEGEASRVNSVQPAQDSDNADDVDAEAATHDATSEIATEAEQFLSEIELVKETLGIDVITRDTLQSAMRPSQGTTVQPKMVGRLRLQLAELREQINELENDGAVLQTINDDQETQLSDLQDEVAKQSDKLRALQRYVSQHGETDVAFADVAPTPYPQDFSELADMVGDLENSGVIFTGDLKTMLGLEANDTLGRAAHTAWDCLLTLGDYVAARNEGLHDAGVAEYLKNVPTGFRAVPLGKFAVGETMLTMQNWGEQRVFPVPCSVDPTGCRTMVAHFRLGCIGMVSPRMYFLDNYASDGRVYVGYVGPHLTNAKTN